MGSRLVKRTRKAPGESARDPLGRLRENYPRQIPPPVPLAQALNAWLEDARKLNKSRRARVQGALQIALQEIGLNPDCAKVQAIGKDGTVQVRVANSSLAHELGVVYKADLLARMRRLLQGKDSLAGLAVKVAPART